MGNMQALTACLPDPVARAVGVPTLDDKTRAKFQAAQTKLNEGIGLNAERERQLSEQIRRVGNEIRRRAAQGDRAGALTLLKSKKAIEASRDKTATTITRLEDHRNLLMDSQFNGELHRVLEDCSVVMAETVRSTSVGKVESTMDALIDAADATREIGDALARPLDPDAAAATEEDDGPDFPDVYPEMAEQLDAVRPGLGSAPTRKKSRLDQELDAFLASAEPDQNAAASPPAAPPKPALAPPPPQSLVNLPPHPLSGATTLTMPFPAVPTDRLEPGQARAPLSTARHHHASASPAYGPPYPPPAYAPRGRGRGRARGHARTRGRRLVHGMSM